MNNDATPADFPPQWREAWSEMQREWDRLHQEIAHLRTERDQLSRALLALMREEVTLSDDEILAQVGREKPLRELLQEMRSQVAGE
jgi:hypothetical protein